MFTGLRQRLAAHGPATTVAVIALIVALCGGAYAAAKGGLTSKQKKQVKALVQQEVKKHPGPPGPAGAKGDPGAPGAQGKEGKAGKDGTNGTNGKSAEVTPIAPGTLECEERGGANVRQEGQQLEEGVELCNGKEGKEGSPWTAGGTLPPGATEVGTWSFQTTSEQAKLSPDPTDSRILVAVSFPIPINLATFSAVEENIEYGPGETADCPGFSLLPAPEGEAPAPGQMCVFQSNLRNTSFLRVASTPFAETPGVGTAGAYLLFSPNTDPTETAFGAGSFAITGCSESLPAGDPNKCPS